MNFEKKMFVRSQFYKATELPKSQKTKFNIDMIRQIFKFKFVYIFRFYFNCSFLKYFTASFNIIPLHGTKVTKILTLFDVFV